MFLLACYLALYPAAFGWLVSKTLKNFRLSLLLMPFLWVALEFFRTYIFSGFPWELLGYSQFENLHLIQIADILGVYGVSFAIICINAAVFAVWHGWGKASGQIKLVSNSQLVGAVSASALILILFWAYGAFRTSQIDALIAASPLSKITVVQGNIDQGVKWDPKFQTKPRFENTLSFPKRLKSTPRTSSYGRKPLLRFIFYTTSP